MRFLRLQIRGFGTLSGDFPLEVGDGRTALLLQPNEAGKSTLAAALLAALYGLESDRRKARKTVVESDLRAPWGGGDFGLSLRLIQGGRELLIERDFQDGSARVLEGGRDLTDEFRRGSSLEIGRRLTGLSRAQFEASAFAGQGRLIWEEASDLGEALQRAADRHSGAQDGAQAALAALERGLKAYPGRTLQKAGAVATEIKRCKEELERIGLALGELERERQEVDTRILRHARIDEEDAAARREESGLELRAQLHAAAQVAEALKRDGEALDRIRKIEEEFHALPAEETAPPSLPELLVIREAWLGARREVGAQERHLKLAESHALRAEERCSELPEDKVVGRPQFELASELESTLESGRLERNALEPRRKILREKIRRSGLPENELLRRHRQFRALPAPDLLTLERLPAQWKAGREAVDELKPREAALRQRRLALRRRRRKQLSYILLLVLPAALILILPLFLAEPLILLPWLAPVATGLLGAALTLVWVAFPGTREESRAMREQEAELKEDQLEAEARAAQARRELTEISARWGASDPEEFLAAWEVESDLADELQELEELEATSAQLEIRETEARSKLEALSLEFLGRGMEEEDDLREALREAAERMQQWKAAREEVTAHRNRLQTALLRQEEFEAKFLAQLTANGEVLPEGEAPDLADEALPQRLQERATRVARRAELGRNLKLLQESRLSEAEREERAGESVRLGAEVERLREEFTRRGGNPDASPWNESLEAGEASRKLRELRARVSERRELWQRERVDVKATLKRIDGLRPELVREKEEFEVALQRALSFRAAVELAREELERIRRETHRLWAAAINRQLPELLEGMGSAVEDLEVDESLRLRMRRKGRLLDEQQARQHLSTGAREQLWLACRIAIARFLSEGGESLPLILDDPFANADDGRLLAGLRLLLKKIGVGQQTLLLACQESRYAWAVAQLGNPPELVRLRPESAENQA